VPVRGEPRRRFRLVSARVDGRAAVPGFVVQPGSGGIGGGNRRPVIAPPPTACQPSWLKCLRSESSQVRTVACAFVVMRSMMASARIFSSMRSCHWLGGSWVQ